MFNPFMFIIIAFVIFVISITAFMWVVERDLRKDLSEICENSFLWIEKLENEILQLKKQLNEK